MPVMILGALCVFATVWFVEQKEKVQWLCESQNMSAQKKLVDAMERLLPLNPIVQSTVVQKKWVQTALRLTPDPYTKIALTLQLALLKLRLAQLAAQQQLIITTTHALSGYDMFSLKRELQAHVSEMENQWRTRLHLNISNSTPRIKLRRKKIDTAAHLYLEHPSLARQQRVNVRISIFGQRLFPKWLQWLSKSPLVWTESCSTQPQKKEAQWSAKLNPGRF